MANVAFADGHVESRTVVNNGAPSWENPAATVLRTKEQVWDLASDDGPFGKQ
jgi:prepilin-type processing-associated H-X9-DG protein